MGQLFRSCQGLAQPMDISEALASLEPSRKRYSWWSAGGKRWQNTERLLALAGESR